MKTGWTAILGAAAVLASCASDRGTSSLLLQSSLPAETYRDSLARALPSGSEPALRLAGLRLGGNVHVLDIAYAAKDPAAAEAGAKELLFALLPPRDPDDYLELLAPHDRRMTLDVHIPGGGYSWEPGYVTSLGQIAGRSVYIASINVRTHPDVQDGISGWRYRLSTRWTAGPEGEFPGTLRLDSNSHLTSPEPVGVVLTAE